MRAPDRGLDAVCTQTCHFRASTNISLRRFNSFCGLMYTHTHTHRSQRPLSPTVSCPYIRTHTHTHRETHTHRHTHTHTDTHTRTRTHTLRSSSSVGILKGS